MITSLSSKYHIGNLINSYGYVILVKTIEQLKENKIKCAGRCVLFVKGHRVFNSVSI